MDLFLLIATIVVAIILLVINIYLLAVYVHPEDRGFGASIFPKIIVVLGMTIAWGQVLMVSLDIANSRGSGGGMNMDVFWEVSVIVSAFMLTMFIPFAMAFYDTDEQKAFRQRLTSAVMYTVVVFVCFIIVFFATYGTFNQAAIPVTTITFATQTPAGASNFGTSTVIIEAADYFGAGGTAGTYTQKVSLPIYVMAFASLIGWVLLVFFGAMGLFAVPIDYIKAYQNQPVKRTPKEIQVKQQGLRERISTLIQMGQNIEESQNEVEAKRGFIAKRSAQAGINKDVNKFKASILALEEDFDIFSAEVNFQNVNPVDYSTKLAAGIFLMIIAVIWWVHILCACLKPLGYNSFLNIFLIWIGETIGLSFISTGIFALLSLYLIAAVTKGNVKFGLRIPFFFTIHPMKPNETLMNSFLFNVWLILTTSIGIVQFLTNTFEQYARLTSAQFFFDIVIKYMKFFSFFYINHVFEYAFLAWSLLGLFCMFFCGEKKGNNEVQTKGGDKGEMVL